MGVVLSQVQNGQERVIAYASRRYADAESRYCVTRRELPAVVYGLRQFRVYLLGRHFKLRTDHAPLTWLQKTPEPIGPQGRWLDLMVEFSFDVEHRP
jgi:RNase H-like domain found in reverse transcriptase